MLGCVKCVYRQAQKHSCFAPDGIYTLQEKLLNTVSANILHRKRSTARYGNTLFSYLAVDLYDKHAKCAYLQAVKHPIFVLEHKHTSHREGMVYQTATQPLVTPVLFQESRSRL